MTDKHIIEIEVTGPFNEKLNQNFKCTTVRSNPAVIGHVTGNQTYDSFYYSLLGRIDLFCHFKNIIFSNFVQKLCLKPILQELLFVKFKFNKNRAKNRFFYIHLKFLKNCI